MVSVIKSHSGNELNRHGTFLHARNGDVNQLIWRLQKRIAEAFKRGNLSEERSSILQLVEKDIAQKAYTDNVREEGHPHSFNLSRQEIDWLKHQSEERWLDYIVYRYKFKIYPKLRKLTQFPLYVLIEPTSVCNLRCVMCFQVDTSFTTKEFMGHMSWELFTSVADQLIAHECPAVTLASRGEPTLHPRFGDMLRYLGGGQIMDLKINTNAIRMSEQLMHDILDAGVNEVVFSVDAGTKDTYEAIRVGGRFEEVVKNIERFREIRDAEYPDSPTVTRISGVQVREDQDAEQMWQFWSRLVDQVTIRRATPRWDSYHNPPSDVSHPCAMLWERLYVWYDGVVNPCDFDYKSYLSVGNAKEMSLEDIWTGEKYRKLRADHLENRKQRVPCDRCPIS